MTLSDGGKLYEIKSGQEHLFLFYCPACEMSHPYRVTGEGPKWDFDGDLTSPTFTPSLRVHNVGENGGDCHLFLTRGEIRFCSDSDHDMAGKIVPLGPFQNYKGEIDEPGGVA